MTEQNGAKQNSCTYGPCYRYYPERPEVETTVYGRPLSEIRELLRRDTPTTPDSMHGVYTCPNCHELYKSGRFCHNCGQRIALLPGQYL